jgi:hypothetical protein
VCNEVVFISGFKRVLAALAGEGLCEFFRVQDLAEQLELLALRAVQHPRLGLRCMQQRRAEAESSARTISQKSKERSMPCILKIRQELADQIQVHAPWSNMTCCRQKA